jgi:hypothetical protein
MANNTVEPNRQDTEGSAAPAGSREVADDIAGRIHSGSPSGSPTSTPEGGRSTMSGQPPLPRRIRPHERTLEDSRGHTA